ncbi:MAG: beta-ureidopropionase [Candidatus Coatesbacteria bacterium]|nr:beta-ureidopropionase [Candidatus Coatesbacteria bacterium]
MKLGVFQFNPFFADPDSNISYIDENIPDILPDVMVFPELCLTGYNFKSKNQLIDISEDLGNSPRINHLSQICKERKGSMILGISERENNDIFNSAVFLNGEGVKFVYRKIHLFNKEKDIFSPGKYHLEPFAWKEVKIGILICFDWAFPEAARTLAMKGAEIICHPCNLVLPYGQKAMRIRALENRIYTVSANRIGTEDDIRFTGKSQIADINGEVIAQLGEKESGYLIADLNVEDARDKSITERNHLFNDRKPEFYDL